MDKERCCGTCRHHLKHVTAGGDDRHAGEWWCACEESDAYGDFTVYSDGCDRYEDREEPLDRYTCYT